MYSQQVYGTPFFTQSIPQSQFYPAQLPSLPAAEKPLHLQHQIFTHGPHVVSARVGDPLSIQDGIQYPLYASQPAPPQEMFALSATSPFHAPKRHKQEPTPPADFSQPKRHRVFGADRAAADEGGSVKNKVTCR